MTTHPSSVMVMASSLYPELELEQGRTWARVRGLAASLPRAETHLLASNPDMAVFWKYNFVHTWLWHHLSMAFTAERHCFNITVKYHFSSVLNFFSGSSGSKYSPGLFSAFFEPHFGSGHFRDFRFLISLSLILISYSLKPIIFFLSSYLS